MSYHFRKPRAFAITGALLSLSLPLSAPAAAFAPPAQARSVEAGQGLAYGRDANQRIAYYPAPATAGKKPPLILYVHGGGWMRGQPERVSVKPAWAGRMGAAFGSIGYRLFPDVPVEQQARDIAAAVHYMRRDAVRLGFDPDHILLVGHSAGAHLAALVSSDPQYLGADMAAIRGVIPIDGACYDIPAQIEAAPFMAKRLYLPTFGTGVARQRALSPVNHAKTPNVARWLILYASGRHDSPDQAQTLASALRTQGTVARAQGVALGHGDMNRLFGTDDYPAQAVVDRFVREALAR